ncbi:DUF3347 domain-containing protein [Pontibacter sp. E15-1]|uniref:DUF3347 domain-containing protein n=1 Tax=Pontibacter sp. E15-1 TaxID=2919918 RepID=UPI001F4F50DB|nr:DUF3347 domain-containing protein [Pontibacter sp. E15-1]MCJ8167117.1 DUF3347 domain-containing protein [Pontibacter sp. E15-1]
MSVADEVKLEQLLRIKRTDNNSLKQYSRMGKILIKPFSIAVTALMLVFLTACDSKKKVAGNEADPMEAHENKGMHYETIHDSMRNNQIPITEFVEGDTLDFDQEALAAFKQQLNRVVDAYLALNESLVAQDQKEVERASTNMMAALLDVNDGLLTGSAHDFGKEKQFFLMDHVELCKEAKSIKERRENLVFISQAMVRRRRPTAQAGRHCTCSTARWQTTAKGPIG